jgi:chromosome segregation ATPase
MNKLAIALLFVAAFADTEDSPLVQAAKSTSNAKKKPTTRVITNADVKKAKGSLTELPGSTTETTKGPTDPARTTQQKHDEMRRSTAAAAQRLAAAEKKVAALERELAKVEQSYFESSDPDYRDKTIAASFKETKRKLEAARKELADAKPAPAKTP